MLRRVLIVAPLLLLCAVLPAAAQTGRLDVCVLVAKDHSALPGATVVLTNEQQLIAPTALVTDDRGCVVFPVLRAGRGYVADVSMPGFARQRFPGLRVGAGSRERLVVQVSPELTERVEVTAATGVVDLEKTGGSTKFDDTFIEHLPVPGRFYQNILALAPGVLDSDGDGNPNVHGGRERDFRAVVGGVSNTDPLTGEWLSFVNTEAIEEIEILQTGAGVEYGRASGGFARILQKQGSNEFEGVFNFIYRSSKFDGGAADDVVSTAEGTDYEWVQPSIQVSGPIVKDKLWFRLSHEAIDREDPIVFLDRFETTRREQTINSDQLTWQISPRNKLAFQFQSDPVKIEKFMLNARTPSSSAADLDRGGDTFTISWVAPVSSRLLVDSTVAYQDHQRDVTPHQEGVAQRCALFGAFNGRFLPLNTARCFNVDTGVTSGSFNETSQDKRQRFTVNTQATYYTSRFLGASHRLKLGFVSENERFFRRLRRGADINFFIETDIFGGNPIGRSSTTVSAPDESQGRATGHSWALYAEDQLRPVDNVSITLGLRYDREEINSPGQVPFDPEAENDLFNAVIANPLVGPERAAAVAFTAFPEVQRLQADLAQLLGVNPVIIPLSSTAIQSQFWGRKRREGNIVLINDNLSPRLSVAWDPWANGKMKIAATAGRYYDKVFLAVPLLEIEPPEVALEFLSIPVGNTFFDAGLNGGLDPAVNAKMVSRDLATPYQDEFTFTIERELWPETAIKLSYVHRKFRDQFQDFDINHGPDDKGFCIVPFSFGAQTVSGSPGSGQMLKDPYSNEIYEDTDPGVGDGRIDDCTGNVFRVGGFEGFDIERPDGLADVYTLNPGWGEILLVGNFNTTDYEAVVVELVRRLYRSWQLDASYTWSEAIGDAEDFNQLLGNERNLLEQERGFVSFDQRHVVKVNAMSITPWGLRLGGSLRWESGLPYSVLRSTSTVFARPPEYLNLADTNRDFRLRYPSGVRNDQRNPSFWTVDLRVAKEFQFGRDVNMQVTVEAFNMLDDNSRELENVIDAVTAGEERFGRQYQLGLRVGF